MEECHESDFYCSCDVFKVSNKRLHLDFEPYAAENSECYLYIKNISDEPQELCFEPPRTSYFLTEFDVSIVSTHAQPLKNDLKYNFGYTFETCLELLIDLLFV